MSKIVDETLSPTWDELIVFERISIHGRKEDIRKNPPEVVIEFYDQDKACTECLNIMYTS